MLLLSMCMCYGYTIWTTWPPNVSIKYMPSYQLCVKSTNYFVICMNLEGKDTHYIFLWQQLISIVHTAIKSWFIIFWHYFVTDLLQLGKCKGSFKWWLSDILGMPYRSSNYISWQILDIFDLFIKITSSNILHYFRKMHLRSLHHWYSIL